MAIHSFSSEDEAPDPRSNMRALLGPGAVDNQIRSAISTCWMMMPAGKRTPDAVAVEIRRIVERALANLTDDQATFGSGADDSPST